jgi:hypothetical protein
MSRVPPSLGVDVGGVIIDRVAENDDTSFFGSRPMETPQVPGTFEALALLTALFGGRVFVVSKAGPTVSARTLAWLAHHRFFEATGIVPENIHFVRQRIDKAAVCDAIGITHFVDDRLDVLAHLKNVPHRYLFVGGLGRNPSPMSVPRWATVAASWPDLADLLTATVTSDLGPGHTPEW